MRDAPEKEIVALANCSAKNLKSSSVLVNSPGLFQVAAASNENLPKRKFERARAWSSSSFETDQNGAV